MEDDFGATEIIATFWTIRLTGSASATLSDFEAQSRTPADRCVSFAIAVTDNYAILATGRPATALPVPVFHRLERASFS